MEEKRGKDRGRWSAMILAFQYRPSDGVMWIDQNKDGKT